LEAGSRGIKIFGGWQPMHKPSCQFAINIQNNGARKQLLILLASFQLCIFFFLL
jgi:hypothetical protein